MTAHTCGGPVFGHRTLGCPRCEELAAGAPPVRWRKRRDDTERLAEIRAHNCRTAKCGPVCTFGDW